MAEINIFVIYLHFGCDSSMLRLLVLKVDVGDHCSATWCIVIFNSNVFQNEIIY